MSDDFRLIFDGTPHDEAWRLVALDKASQLRRVVDMRLRFKRAFNKRSKREPRDIGFELSMLRALDGLLDGLTRRDRETVKLWCGHMASISQPEE